MIGRRSFLKGLGVLVPAAMVAPAVVPFIEYVPNHVFHHTYAMGFKTTVEAMQYDAWNDQILGLGQMFRRPGSLDHVG